MYIHGLYVREFRKRGMKNGKEHEECDVFGICNGKRKSDRI